MGLRYKDIEGLSIDELKARHDKMADTYGDVPMTIRDVINWRESSAQTTAIRGMTNQMRIATWVITLLTAVNVALTAVLLCQG